MADVKKNFKTMKNKTVLLYTTETISGKWCIHTSNNQVARLLYYRVNKDNMYGYWAMGFITDL